MINSHAYMLFLGLLTFPINRANGQEDPLTPPLTLKLKLISSEVKMGEPILLNIEVTNLDETLIILPWDILPFLHFTVTDSSDQKVHFETNVPEVIWEKIPFNILMPGDKWIIQIDLKRVYPLQRGDNSKSLYFAFPNIRGHFVLYGKFRYPGSLLFDSVEIFDRVTGGEAIPKEYVKKPYSDMAITTEKISFKVY